ncbi:glutathione S-transferase theta-1-like [Bradysia coprophila]|uniref:glutathione S-transferase theta-1-like n=1 Tax=Bradysia coprophila TaxID=38358 RepID=UPI00187DAA30|nr:glutathione S-transferase theta-1-like [Bradysia coprophila]
MSKQLKFYYDLMSQPARALYMFLKLNQIPHEPCYVSIGKGEHQTDDYEQNVNRFKKIPAIVDKDFKLSESIAIYRYLASEYKVADNWYPKDVKKRARVDEYLEWQHLNTRFGCSLYFISKWLLPVLMRQTVSEGRVAEAKARMEDALDAITNIWLKDQQFIAGNEITVADLVAATEIEQLVVTDYNPFEGRPTLKAWIEKVKSKTNPHYEDAHKMIYRAASKNKAKL